MTTIEFIKAHRRVMSISRLELYCRVPRNTIAHAIGNEKRKLPLAYEDQIQRFLVNLDKDLSTCLSHYWKSSKADPRVNKLPSSNGVSSKRKHTGKRKA